MKRLKTRIYQAVAQAKGVQVSSGQYAFGFDAAAADVETKDDKGKTVGIDAVSLHAKGTLSQSEINGLVKTYEIVEEKKLDDKTYQVMLKVWVLDYKAPDENKRIRVAMMPLEPSRPFYQFLNQQVPAIDIIKQLSHKLSTAMSETNKFSVLEREDIQQFAAERKLVAFTGSIEEQAKIGKLLGADYMLIGTVSNVQLRKKQERSQATGYTFGEFEADFDFDYRLVSTPTMQVKMADTINLKLRTLEIKQLVKIWDPEELDINEIKDGIISMAASKVVETIIDRLYPVRIAEIQPDGQIILNQGGKRIAEGMIFDVFTQGKEIIDSDTNESLGMTETFVAKLKVDKVAQKISYAQPIDGDKTKLTKGLICRPQNRPSHQNLGEKAK